MELETQTATEKLKEMCPCGTKELDRLLARLVDLAPVVRQQQSAANRVVEAAYFNSDEPTPEDKAMWFNSGIMDGCTLMAINYRSVRTPEAYELKSICLAVAAFGGVEAIQLIGWALSEDRDCDMARRAVWSTCDGMAGFVL